MSSYQYYHHHLTVTGPETERERFMAECFSRANDKINFDFSKLVPGADLNAIDTEVVREGETILLVFYAALGLPVPVFDEVARRFPNLKIEGTWTETEYRHGGDILCQDGNVEIEDRSEELRSAFEAMLDAHAKAAKLRRKSRRLSF